MNRQAVLPERGSYGEVVSAIQRTEGSLISVPDLSTLLGVKSTTLNARFRRENRIVRTIGRTNFISQEVALRLAELHKYALTGWLTLKHASELTGVKSATIKAWCEAGQLEGHIDLTKRLRIAPSALQSFRPADRRPNKASEPGRSVAMPAEACLLPDNRKAGTKRNRLRFSPPTAVQAESPFRASGSSKVAQADGYPARISTTPRPFVMPPPPEPQIRILTRKDYGLPEIEEGKQAKVTTARVSGNKQRKGGCLSYDPERPFSVSECAVGRHIKYAQDDGKILSIIDDPFNPQIKVAFPRHQDPLMREVLLIVGRRG